MHLDNRSCKLRPQLMIPRGSERRIQGNSKVPNSNIRDTNGHFSPLGSLFSDLNRFRISIRIFQSHGNGIKKTFFGGGYCVSFVDFVEELTGTPDYEPAADRIILYLLLIHSLFLEYFGHRP